MDRRMGDRRLIRLSQVPECLAREKLEDSDWVTFGVLVNKATPQSSSSVGLCTFLPSWIVTFCVLMNTEHFYIFPREFYKLSKQRNGNICTVVVSQNPYIHFCWLFTKLKRNTIYRINLNFSAILQLWILILQCFKLWIVENLSVEVLFLLQQ